MDLFGVHDLPTSKSASAGWAYIPDTLSSAAAPTSRKRARHTASAHDQSARQDAKVARDLAALEREGGGREVSIPVVPRGRDGAGRATHGKVTPAVRKILQSQKTFANHLSDAEALAALAPPSSTTAAPSTTAAATSTPTPAAASPAPTAAQSKRGYKRRSLAAGAAATPTPPPMKIETPQPDTVMADADADAGGLLLSTAPNFTPHPGDSDPLLRSRIPSMPTKEEVESLLAERPRGYLEAKAGFEGTAGGGAARVKGRRFCEVCGYWGRVRCMACGTRCCALECLGVHREECFGGYGA
ncbi:hypothetical protein VE01_10090 [Pseudogymnoascus verrucosus]|uniref:HIT-type domain-containing protein n=1 Tax=Pseudogymnoascus verrucosus TaxID=342668 RepID=A0A1B8G8I9_9PEZI|nr:uncharacterized protein VE01_10090 [Pseudogymnoascus verrucosus]OBT92144.1 hypothetical protein VE01_10090 [Pseudogymnoascus verrucosus]